MTVGDLVEQLRQLDPEAVVCLLDRSGLECHVGPVTVRHFTVTLEAGRLVTEEDLA